MNKFLKIALIGAFVGSLAACSSNTTTPTSTNLSPMDNQAQCNAIEKKMRMLDRSKPGANAQYRKLDDQLSDLNCGAK